jgi:heavy metal translocating P-type ATPase
VRLILPVLALAALLTGFVAGDLGPRIWMVALVLLGGRTVLSTLRGMLRGDFAADIVASLAILGAVAFNEPLAGLIVVLMQTGGEALEHWAEGRATAAVRALEDSAPRIAHRLTDGSTEDIPVEQVRVGDRLLVRPGEMVPADGEVAEGEGEVDLARLTGEPIPELLRVGSRVRSGAVALARPLVITATAVAGDSLYARIVELVREAQAAKAPLQRLADRAAVWFTPFTLLVCAATWLLTGDAVRVLAVLVVATPCPLILAAPVAIIGGINRAARGRVVVRTGAALERLASVTAVALDKTGTLTVGHPEVAAVHVLDGLDEATLLRLAASLEQRSGHPIAQSVVRAARARGLPLSDPQDVHEAAGRGIEGLVGGQRVAVGSARWAREVAPAAAAALDALPPAAATETTAVVLVDGVVQGALVFADALRPGLDRFVRGLAALGIRRSILLSGDRDARVQEVARALGVAEAHGDLLPDDKVRWVRTLVADGERVAMIGDGVNDAPALSAAHVGIALAAHGGGIAAESADAVLLADDLTRAADAIAVARRSMRIARQSIGVGIGLSVVAMGFAAAGLLPPVAGALVQEAIDVAVILNAIRAAGPGLADRG